MAKAPQALANAAHAAWNCGRPKAAQDLADLVESFGGIDLMDVIRVNGDVREAVGERASSASHATRDIDTEQR